MSTLSGAQQKIKKNVRLESDRFFGARSGNALGALIEQIRKYRLVYEKYEDKLELNGFSGTLYLAFQDFKMNIDTFMAERLNPEVIRFIKEKEEYIEEQIKAVAVPYETMVKDALAKYSIQLSDFGINATNTREDPVDFPAFDSIKSASGLNVPALMTSMHFSAKIKTEAIMHLGFYTFIKFIKKIFKKDMQSRDAEAQALKKGMFRIKQEMEKAVLSHFVNYRENLKFQYFFKLIDTVSNAYYQALVDRFNANSNDHSDIAALIGEKQADKERA